VFPSTGIVVFRVGAHATRIAVPYRRGLPKPYAVHLPRYVGRDMIRIFTRYRSVSDLLPRRARVAKAALKRPFLKCRRRVQTRTGRSRALTELWHGKQERGSRQAMPGRRSVSSSAARAAASSGNKWRRHFRSRSRKEGPRENQNRLSEARNSTEWITVGTLLPHPSKALDNIPINVTLRLEALPDRTKPRSIASATLVSVSIVLCQSILFCVEHYCSFTAYRRVLRLRCAHGYFPILSWVFSLRLRSCT
jgi:hypothetical protein